MQQEISNHDYYLITKALAIAVLAMDRLPDDMRPAHERADMSKLLRDMVPHALTTMVMEPAETLVFFVNSKVKPKSVAPCRKRLEADDVESVGTRLPTFFSEFF